MQAHLHSICPRQEISVTCELCMQHCKQQATCSLLPSWALAMKLRTAKATGTSQAQAVTDLAAEVMVLMLAPYEATIGMVMMSTAPSPLPKRQVNPSTRIWTAGSMPLVSFPISNRLCQSYAAFPQLLSGTIHVSSPHIFKRTQHACHLPIACEECLATHPALLSMVQADTRPKIH